MNILIGCDVDPILPVLLRRPPDTDIWKPLDQIDRLIATMGKGLPVITWLIRSDESVRFCTDSYASGFISRQKLWRRLMEGGHELGWHMHHLSFNRRHGSFGFDPTPSWLSAAHAGLEEHFHIRATRVGWDYGSNVLFNRLDKLGIQIDFSAVPGNIGWHRAGHDRVVIDWRHCPTVPYHPDRDDYQKEGPNALRLLEVPITQFPNSVPAMAKRSVWRIGNRCFSMTGLHNRTLKMTDPWPPRRVLHGGVLAFFFHPEELTDIGVSHFVRNVEQLRQLQGVKFVTASQLSESVEQSFSQVTD
jgi:hypothetical protein